MFWNHAKLNWRKISDQIKINEAIINKIVPLENQYESRVCDIELGKLDAQIVEVEDELSK